MNEYPEADQINEIINNAKSILIVQADNPDGDSMGSALALEEIFGDMGKEVSLYCGLDIPIHLRHMQGWSRVSKDLPDHFDATVIVDTSAILLLDRLGHSITKLRGKPTIILDHHDTENSIDFATVVCNKKSVATGEVIFKLAKQLSWPLNLSAKKYIAISILSDSLGLTVPATTYESFYIIGELVKEGISVAELEQNRRDQIRKSPELVHYKGELLKRVEYHYDNRIATIVIPWNEIQKYSSSYNPPMLVIDEMRQTTGTDVAIAFKIYNDGHLTGKIRCNYGYGIGIELAQKFGGGGHEYASGFKIEDGRPIDEIMKSCLDFANELLKKIDKQEGN